jgi:hypothetical protein
MTNLLDIPWLFGLITVSGETGAIGSFLLYLLLLPITGAKSEASLSRQFLYAEFMAGIPERLFFTSLIGLFGPAAGTPSHYRNLRLDWR